MQYWAHGTDAVSIGQICQLTQVSKPGVYREFGSDDGLKAAALNAYGALAIEPFLAIFRTQAPLEKTIEQIVSFLMQDREKLGIPLGCLLVSMRAQRDRLGPESMRVLDTWRAQLHASFLAWIETAKQAGEFHRDIPSHIAAHHIDALHTGAVRMQKENVPAHEIKQFLQTGLAALTGKTLGPEPQVTAPA